MRARRMEAMSSTRNAARRQHSTTRGTYRTEDLRRQEFIRVHCYNLLRLVSRSRAWPQLLGVAYL
jgi:hypothetical protein